MVKTKPKKKITSKRNAKPKSKTKPKGSAKPRVKRQPLPVSNPTLSRYRKEGLDVDTDGKPDHAKILKVRAEKQDKLRYASSNSIEAQSWDVRYRKAKAMDMERQLAVNLKQLIPKRDVERQAFEMSRRVRDYLLNIPNRIAGELTAGLGLKSSEGQEKVYQILNREIHLALEQLN